MSPLAAGFVIGFACVALGVALGALYALAKFSISQGRFDLDALTKAWNIRRAIDEAVMERVATVQTFAPVPRPSPKIGPQPNDPNVQERRILDEVAEMERDMNRVMSSSEYEKRDRTYSSEQPPQPLEL